MAFVGYKRHTLRIVGKILFLHYTISGRRNVSIWEKRHRRGMNTPGKSMGEVRLFPAFLRRCAGIAFCLGFALAVTIHLPHSAPADPLADPHKTAVFLQACEHLDSQEQLLSALHGGAFFEQKGLRSTSSTVIGHSGDKPNGSPAFRNRASLDSFWHACGLWSLPSFFRVIHAKAILPAHSRLRLSQGEWTLLGKSLSGHRLFMSIRSFLFFRGDTERMRKRSA